MKIGQRNRDLKLTTTTLDALINSIKHGQVLALAAVQQLTQSCWQALEVDSAQELLQKLSSLQLSEALSEHECSHSILMSATCKLNSEARLLSVVGSQIASLGEVPSLALLFSIESNSHANKTCIQICCPLRFLRCGNQNIHCNCGPRSNLASSC